MNIIDFIKTNISIRDYLAGRQIFPAKEYKGYGMYHAPYREDKNPSLKVDYNKKLWKDFGYGNKGGSIIDLVMVMDNCNEGEAIRKLSQGNYLSEAYLINNDKKDKVKDSAIQIIEKKELQHPALLKYLEERGIPLSIAREYCKEIHYSITNNGKYFSIGFQNDKGGYELRNSACKTCTSKFITTLNNNSKSCLVFEGFMNFLSYLTLKNTSKAKENILVLNSIINISKAKDFLQKHEKIYCYLDNDEGGKSAFEKLLLMELNVIDKSSSYKNFGDLNDYLKHKIRLKTETKKPKNTRKM